MLRITIGNEEPLLFDDDKLTLVEAKLLYKFTKKGVKALFGTDGNDDPEKIQAMVWVARHRAGVTPNRYSEIDFDLSELDMVELDEDGNPIPDDAPPANDAEDGDEAGNGESAATT